MPSIAQTTSIIALDSANSPVPYAIITIRVQNRDGSLGNVVINNEQADASGRWVDSPLTPPKNRLATGSTYHAVVINPQNTISAAQGFMSAVSMNVTLT